MKHNIWSRKTDSPGVLRRTTVLAKDTSIEDLLTWCIENNLPTDQVFLTGGHVTWTSPETPEEVAAREAASTRAQERQEEWERETLVRLTEKYGTPA